MGGRVSLADRVKEEGPGEIARLAHFQSTTHAFDRPTYRSSFWCQQTNLKKSFDSVEQGKDKAKWQSIKLKRRTTSISLDFNYESARKHPG